MTRFAAAVVAILVLAGSVPRGQAVELRVGTFQVDVTPPSGSPLCDGLVPPATGVNDPLTARGVVLEAEDQPAVVLVAVDWVGIGNEGHDAWREAIAEACDTTADRVCVHALHQHDAPGCDFLSNRIAAEAGLDGQLFNVAHARDSIRRAAAAARDARSKPAQITHIGRGKGRVEKVASNRRVLGPDGKVQYVRYSSGAKDPKMAELPEGLIDPDVRLVSFWEGDRAVAVLSYYAVHPQSYYYTGKASADFVGMARDQAERREGTDLHVHFNGAGGNVTAGKYNDGSPERRPVLADRLADGMRLAWENTEKSSIDDMTFDWATRGVNLPVADWYDEAERRAILNDGGEKLIPRLQAARAIAWAGRTQAGNEITIARLRLGPIDILHLPGELFVEYQLAAQRLRPDAFVCMAAYGDYGPGYIGTADAYPQGGYETGLVSRVSPRSEAVLMGAIRELLE